MSVSRPWWRPDLDTGPPAIAIEPEAERSAVPFWALTAFSFILLVAPQEQFPVLVPLRLALVTGATALIGHLVDRVMRREPLTVLTREIGIAAGLLAWAVGTVPLSVWPGGSVEFLGFYLRSLAIFWLLANTVSTLRRLHQLAWALTLMSVPLALTAMDNFLDGAFLPGGPPVKRILGYQAPLTGNPNDLALMLNLLIPLSVALALTAKRRPIRNLLLAVVAADVAAVIVTFSRGGFVTLATVFAVYVWKVGRRPERIWACLAVLAVLACLPFLPAGYLDRISNITHIDADPTGSAKLRWNDAGDAVRLVLDNPVTGAGVGMNALALYQTRQGYWTAVHNVYLEYAVELGLPGLLLFGLLLVECVKSVRRVQRRVVGVPALRELFCLAEAVQVSLVAFSVGALFHPVGYHMYFYYVAGMAVAVRVIGDDKHLKAA
ncbi:MAG: hypothetical protein DME04_01495 [Candidatus Rokuibacteriota bacterium]|nr:MAG: hypothetical protein DME04_01495 [Candidatus Rokubacteria bacterium]